MSFPFGGHPTLEQFLTFAKSYGCTAKLVTRTSKAGKAYQALEITNVVGGRTVVVEPNWSEHLAPSMVTHLQRRLGIKSPFAALPEHAASSDTTDGGA